MFDLNACGRAELAGPGQGVLAMAQLIQAIARMSEARGQLARVAVRLNAVWQASADQAAEMR